MVGFERTCFYNDDIKPLFGAIFHVDSNDIKIWLAPEYGNLERNLSYFWDKHSLNIPEPNSYVAKYVAKLSK